MFPRSIRGSLSARAQRLALGAALGGAVLGGAVLAGAVRPVSLSAQTPPAATPPPASAQAPAAPVTPSPSVAKGSRCFEMRTYYAAPGRSEALHKRFREHTTKLFEKHGMTNVAYWVPDDKPDVIVYVLAYPSRAARDASWKAFTTDPAWTAVRAASEQAVGGGSLTTKVESVFMQATDYSTVK